MTAETFDNKFFEERSLASKAIQRESALREIMFSSANDFNIKNVIKSIVTVAGQVFEADRCFFVNTDGQFGANLEVCEYAEYVSSEEILPQHSRLTTIDEVGIFRKLNKLKQSLFVENVIDVELPEPSRKMLVEDLSVKSFLVIPVYYGDYEYGSIVFHYVKNYSKFSDDDIQFAQAIANHSAIVLHQAKLYYMAQDNLRLKSDFISMISHELKTPLNVIIGFSDLLSQSDVDAGKQKKYLENINQCGKYLLSLTNDIINMANIESGNFTLSFEKFDLKLLIVEVLNSLSLIAEEKNITIEMNLLEINVFSDRKVLTQIMYNLLSNAIKFNIKGGKVIINLSKNQSELMISVEDNGIGIDSKDFDVIFEKFKQLNDPLDRPQQGSGLGLSITKNLVELLDGLIHVESKKDKGSRFSVVLPV